MYCTNCGSWMPDDTKFCTNCGVALSTPDSEKMSAVSRVAENAAADSTPVILPGQGGLPIFQAESGGGGGRKKTFLIIALILAILLAAGLTAGGVYLAQSGAFDDFWGGRGETDEKDDERESRKSKKEEDTKEEEEDTEEEEAEPAAEEEAVIEQIPITINVRQVDNTNFPEVTLYATITDEQGNVVEDIKTSDFTVQEIDKSGAITESSLEKVEKALGAESANVNLVLDASGSMDGSNKMEKAKQAAESFLNQVNLSGGDKVEIISFDDFVYLEQSFTSRYEDLYSALYGVYTGGSTALFDAIYAGLIETYNQDGAKCVIAFTDGAENASSYTFEDVAGLAQNTGIPVFIIGIGSGYDASILMDLAQECSGGYYSADEVNLSEILESIYMEIYQEQQDYYVFHYKSQNLDNTNEFRNVTLATTQTAGFSGEYTKEYIPVADLSGGFSQDYASKDYMITDSGSRPVTEADLKGMSLAELRIARNEIFARHGRQFKDSMLNKWFYSKNWYLNVPEKYAPDDFDKLSPPLLSELERDNTEFILAYEQAIMETEDIYPDAAAQLLSEYDLCLSKQVLKRALEQMQTYSSTQTLEENKALVREAIERDDVEY